MNGRIGNLNYVGRQQNWLVNLVPFSCADLVVVIGIYIKHWLRSYSAAVYLNQETIVALHRILMFYCASSHGSFRLILLRLLAFAHIAGLAALLLSHHLNISMLLADIQSISLRSFHLRQ